MVRDLRPEYWELCSDGWWPGSTGWTPGRVSSHGLLWPLHWYLQQRNQIPLTVAQDFQKCKSKRHWGFLGSQLAWYHFHCMHLIKVSHRTGQVYYGRTIIWGSLGAIILEISYGTITICILHRRNQRLREAKHITPSLPNSRASALNLLRMTFSCRQNNW